MSKAGKILSPFLLLLATACSTKYVEVVPDTELRITVVRGTTQAPLAGATIYLYTSDTSFHKTISSVATPSGFVSSFTADANGDVLVSGLKSTVQYYVYAYYKDSTIIQGTYITLDNSSAEYLLKNNLPQGSISNITIAVQPSDGFIVFWTKESNSAALPISVFVGSASVGTLLSATETSLGGITQRVKSGVSTIEGKSSIGCVWNDQVSVTAGTISNYNFSDCTVGTIAFYTDAVNANVLPIQITLNANDGIGSIGAIVNSSPTDCSTSNLLTSVRTPGNYTYQAISSTGDCVWNGEFTLVANECHLLYLTQCN